jgi:hypothetical protein
MNGLAALLLEYLLPVLANFIAAKIVSEAPTVKAWFDKEVPNGELASAEAIAEAIAKLLLAVAGGTSQTVTTAGSVSVHTTVQPVTTIPTYNQD